MYSEFSHWDLWFSRVMSTFTRGRALPRKRTMQHERPTSPSCGSPTPLVISWFRNPFNSSYNNHKPYLSLHVWITFTYMSRIFEVNVGKSSIHGASGLYIVIHFHDSKTMPSHFMTSKLSQWFSCLNFGWIPSQSMLFEIPPQRTDLSPSAQGCDLEHITIHLWQSWTCADQPVFSLHQVMLVSRNAHLFPECIVCMQKTCWYTSAVYIGLDDAKLRTASRFEWRHCSFLSSPTIYCR